MFFSGLYMAVLNISNFSTQQKDNKGIYYILDNAGSIMSAVSNKTYSSLFCFSVKLKEEVDKNLLLVALEKTIKRYPYFYCRLKKGLFWYYLEPLNNLPLIEDNIEPCCINYDINKPGNPLFRIRCFKNFINAEFSHSLTDGFGGMEFLKTLLYEYFLSIGFIKDSPDTDKFLNKSSSSILNEEYEDSYKRYFSSSIPKPQPLPIAFHIPSKELPENRYRIIVGTLNLEKTLETARKKKLTLTEFLSSIYIYSLQKIYFSLPAKKRKRMSVHIKCEIPINLRKFLPSRTLRNFSLFMLAGVDCRMGEHSLDEIFELTHHQFQGDLRKKEHLKMLKRNVASEYLFAVRMIPLFLKIFVLKISFYLLGEGLLSGFLSNFGSVNLPDEFADYIERFDFIPAPGKATKTNCSVISYRNCLSICFGSRITSRELEKNFFRTLVELGLEVSVKENLI